MHRDRNWLKFRDLGVVAVTILACSFTATSSPLQAAPLCAHPYFPVSLTSERVYETTYRIGLPPLRSVERIKDPTDTGFTQ